MFDGYTSQIDWPCAHIWRELAQAFSDAKVLLIMRPEASWARSFSATIGKVFKVHESIEAPPHIKTMLTVMKDEVLSSTFDGDTMDVGVLIRAYRTRKQEVQASISPDRLLVFDVAEGWEPLCRFLDVPVPDAPFPHENEREMFWQALAGEPEL